MSTNSWTYTIWTKVLEIWGQFNSIKRWVPILLSIYCIAAVSHTFIKINLRLNIRVNWDLLQTIHFSLFFSFASSKHCLTKNININNINRLYSGLAEYSWWNLGVSFVATHWLQCCKDILLYLQHSLYGLVFCWCSLDAGSAHVYVGEAKSRYTFLGVNQVWKVMQHIFANLISEDNCPSGNNFAEVGLVASWEILQQHLFCPVSVRIV